MNKSTVRKVLIGALAVVCIASGGYAMKTAQDFHEEVEIYETAQTEFVTIIEDDVPLAALPVELTEAPAMEGEPLATLPAEVVEVEQTCVPVPDITVDFDGLTQVNQDVVAWIHIPQETISYPVTQGADNAFYLKKSYDGSYSYSGSIFLDYRSSDDFTDQNTLIYGHNVNSGTMFSPLLSYKDQAYAQENPYIFLLTPEGNLAYEVCYAMVTAADSDVYQFAFTEENTFAYHLADLAGQSLYDMEVAVTEQDKLITLSTCTNVSDAERFVVVAKLLTVQ